MARSVQEIHQMFDMLRAKLDSAETVDADEILAATLTPPKPRLRQIETPAASPEPTRRAQVREPTDLDIDALIAQRIVAFDGSDERSRPYDLLRAQLLRLMERKNWRLVGLTSPTEGCGKTLTAINLAFSAARHHGLEVLLVDMNLFQPKLAEYLGLTLQNKGVLDLIEGRTTLPSSVIPVSAGSETLLVLPTASTPDPSALTAGDALANLLRSLRAAYPAHLIIFDLPSILTSDDAIAVPAEVDCFALVTAAGMSKLPEIERCLTIIPKAQLARVIVNKAAEGSVYG